MKNKTNEQLVEILIKIHNAEKTSKEQLEKLSELKEKILNELSSRR